MALLLDIGATSVKTYWALKASATGLDLTGATITGLTGEYQRSLTGAGCSAVVTFACVAHSSVTCNWVDGRAIEASPTWGKGRYRVDFPDAAFASGADFTLIACSYGSTSFTEHQLVQFRIPVDAGGSSITAIKAKTDQMAFTIANRLDASVTLTGSGAITWPYHVDDSGTGLPIEGVRVWVSTDIADTIRVAEGYTNSSGVITFYLSAGSYYFWSTKDGYTFTNPNLEVVA
jgi:hypothetical protein